MTTDYNPRKELRVAAHSLSDTIALFSAMAHPCRLRMLILLAEGQVCDVTKLADLCGKRQPYISQQLRILRDVGPGDQQPGGSTGCYRIAANASRPSCRRQAYGSMSLRRQGDSEDCKMVPLIRS